MTPRGIALLGSCLLLSAALLVHPARSSAARWRPIGEVASGASVRVLVSGKPRVYYRVSSDSPVSFSIKGPAQLRLVSRVVFSSTKSPAIAYRIRLAGEGRVWKEHATESSPAPKARLKEGGAPVGKSRAVLVKVPDGEHALTLSCEGPATVLVRILVAERSAVGAKLVSITPVEAVRSVTVSEGEKLISYYTVTTARPARLRIVGPTRLELSVRLDFDSTMRGVQPYKISVAESGHRPRDARFRTTKSAAATYTDLKDRVPSKLDRMVLDLGPGLHDLSVALVEPRGGSIEIHARIPEQTIGGQE